MAKRDYPMTRDRSQAKILNRLCLAAARQFDVVSEMRQQALAAEAPGHARLYARVADELSDAMCHLDCAATLMDPSQTDAADF